MKFNIKRILQDESLPKKEMTEDEEADEIIRRLSTPPLDLSNFRRIVLPIVRNIIPTLVASEIIGVQPMRDLKSDTKKDNK